MGILIIFIVIVVIAAILIIQSQNKIQRETAEQSAEVFAKLYEEQGFNVNKEIEIKTYANNMENNFNQLTKFVVDDNSKKFGVISYNSTTKKAEFKCYEYSKLINFNLFEDGEQLIAGRGLAAAGGALMFGVAGAVIGSVAGNRKVKNKCSELSVRIQVNDLQNPLLTLAILANCDKSGSVASIYYNQAKKVADDVIATLTYIEANK